MYIKECTALEILEHKDFAALKKEYIWECANGQLPIPHEKLEMYKALDKSGTLYAYAAFEDDTLIGFVVLLCSQLPHYGKLIAIVESLFVAKKYRKKGPGIQLIREAEKKAKELGSPGIIISAPIGGSLDKLLPRLKYQATNIAYTKEL